jgi:glycosyltransferase involved in cell wall biosynthesis
MQLSAIPRFDGIIALSPMTLSDFAPDRPGLVMEGGVAGDLATHALPPPDVAGDRIRLLYAGALTEMAGVDLLLDAFAQLAGPHWQLTVTGAGVLEERVRSAAQRDARITYLGFLDRAALLREYAAADVVVNPHRTSLRTARYVFPSKLLEYLASGRLTVTTRAPWADPEFERHCMILDDESPHALAALLRDVAALPVETRAARGATARAWVVQAKSWDRQGARIAEFLTGLGPRSN